MSDWENVKIEDCADILDHLRIPVNEEERNNRYGYTPYYGANGLQGTIEGWLFDEPLILMAEDGGYFDDFEKRPVAYKIEGKSWVNNHAHVIRPKESFDFNYIFYSLEHKNVVPFIKGGTRAKLNQKELRAIELQIPSKKECQKQISRILSSVNQTIEKTESLIQKYQQIKQGLMHDLFTRGVAPDGKLRPAREQAPELYKETPIGWVPKVWDVKPLGDIVSFQRGHDITETKFRDGNIPVVSSGGVIGYHNQATTKAPNVVVGRKGTIGKVHFLDVDFWAHDTSLFSTNLFGNEPLFVFYLCVWLNLGKYGTKSGSPSLNRNDIHPIEVAHPQFSEQKKIVTCLASSDEKISSFEKDLHKLLKVKSGLMHDLLTGKVRVKVDE